MIEIRGQQASDWEDIYAIRTLTAGALPYLRPDWVKQELARPGDRAWPLVAVAQLEEGPRVVARANLEFGTGRRGHHVDVRLEQHPELGLEAGRQLLGRAIEVAEKWWIKSRLAVTLPSTDPAGIALFESFGFVREARLRQAVRIAGRLVDEWMLARLTGEAARSLVQAAAAAPPPPVAAVSRQRVAVRVRGGGGDDWEAYHQIWAQPSVYWGTMQIPHPSADWNRERVQMRSPERFWPLVAEADGRVVGNSGLHRDEHHRSHAAHVGMMVDSAYQGMGVGSALMEAVIDLAENWLGLSRLQLEVFVDNARAIGLYRRYGFEEEGVLQAHSFRDGRFMNTLVMGRLSGKTPH